MKMKKSNELRFYDMSGNVAEFCVDYKNKYPGGEVHDPIGSKKDENRVRCGGDWGSELAGSLRIVFRRRIETYMCERGIRIITCDGHRTN